MTLFLECNIWVWKCLFMLESRYKHITYTHWCTHAHMGRQLCVYVCVVFSPNTRDMYIHTYWWAAFAHFLVSTSSKGQLGLSIHAIQGHYKTLKTPTAPEVWQFSGLFVAHNSCILTVGESINWNYPVHSWAWMGMYQYKYLYRIDRYEPISLLRGFQFDTLSKQK